MPNDWFQFKQFKIHQDKCAMKVSTDACIQGAWAAKQLKVLYPDSHPDVLDIGTGTGLLSLMLAQTLPTAHIIAIEINEAAYLQASSNFDDTDFGKQIQASHTSLKTFVEQPSNKGKYHFIICNPPFFQNHLESTEKARNDARHSQSLSKEELAIAATELLHSGGQFCVMFPASEWENWMKTAKQNGLHLNHSLHVKPKPDQASNRIIGIFSKQSSFDTPITALVIYNSERQYTTEMQHLLKDFYLAF
jgi:tRNA1Val (adenine37-N6)-methyltransferase